MAKKNMKRCSISLIIREMQIKATKGIISHWSKKNLAIIKKIYKQQMLESMWRKGALLIPLVGM